MLPNVEYIKTLINGLKEFVNSKIKLVRKDIDSLPQADWAQNDPTAKDYVKNRTHYTETQEYEVGTAISGWWDVTNGGSNPIIPKMSFCGVVYKDLVPNNIDGIDYYYNVGDYTFRFHAAYGEEYRYMTIDPHYEGSYDSIIFYAINEVVTPIPNKYIINSDFIITATIISEDSKTVTLDKTFDQIREAIRDGKRAVMHIANTSESENGFSSLQLLINDSRMIVFSGTRIMGIDYSVTITIAINKKNEVRLFNGSAPVMGPEATFPQLEMF